MGRHLASKELDDMHRWLSDGHSPVQIHKRLAGAREEAGQDAPNLTTIRGALKGMTHNRSRVETRGRKKKLTTHNLQTLGRVRVQLIEKADGEAEVHWDDIIMKARVPTVDRTTASTRWRAVGYDVRFRQPRLKPARSDIDEAQRSNT